MSTTKVSKEQRRAMALQQALTDKVVIVTGASSGIGAATAKELARYGAQVVLAARREDELAKQVAEITGAGHLAVAIQTDISDKAQITRLVDQVLERFGRVDVLVNNAGVGWQKPFVDESVERIDQMLDINLRGAILATHAVLPGMLERRNGAIIAVASVAGRIAVSSMYSATKYGLRGFMLALRRELAGTGVAASVVSPGFIRTALGGDSRLPMPGPDVVARAIADLVVKPRREVIVPGYYVPLVALGNSLPRLLDVGLRVSGATPSMRKRKKPETPALLVLPVYGRGAPLRSPWLCRANLHDSRARLELRGPAKGVKRCCCQQQRLCFAEGFFLSYRTPCRLRLRVLSISLQTFYIFLKIFLEKAGKV